MWSPGRSSVNGYRASTMLGASAFVCRHGADRSVQDAQQHHRARHRQREAEQEAGAEPPAPEDAKPGARSQRDHKLGQSPGTAIG